MILQSKNKEQRKKDKEEYQKWNKLNEEYKKRHDTANKYMDLAVNEKLKGNDKGYRKYISLARQADGTPSSTKEALAQMPQNRAKRFSFIVGSWNCMCQAIR